jgi:type III secretion system low calcium response chaperone LcrH/SycD
MTKRSKNILMGYDLDDPKQKEELTKNVMEQVQQGIPLKVALGVSDDSLEHVYSLAYNKYQRGEYAEAVHLFRYLVSIDPEAYKFCLGLAASLHKSHEYQPAANVYVLATVRNPKDPVPYFHAADCFLHLNDRDMAKAALYLCMKMCGDSPEFSRMRERAYMIHSALEGKEVSVEKPKKKPSSGGKSQPKKRPAAKR